MPIVRRRHEPEKTSNDDRISGERRESLSMPRTRTPLGPMREPMPTAEFSPDALAEALERLRADEPEEDPGPRRTQSGERKIVRPPIATAPAQPPSFGFDDDGPVVEARIEEYEEDEDELAPTTLASEPVVAESSRELGVTVTPMELAPLPVAIVPNPEPPGVRRMPAPLLPTLLRTPASRGFGMVLTLVVLAAVTATLVLAFTHRL